MMVDPATQANPFLGLVLHSIGGLAAASFYIPYRRVRNWSRETYGKENIGHLPFSICHLPLLKAPVDQ